MPSGYVAVALRPLHTTDSLVTFTVACDCVPSLTICMDLMHAPPEVGTAPQSDVW